MGNTAHWRARDLTHVFAAGNVLFSFLVFFFYYASVVSANTLLALAFLDFFPTLGFFVYVIIRLAEQGSLTDDSGRSPVIFQHVSRILRRISRPIENLFYSIITHVVEAITLSRLRAGFMLYLLLQALY